MQWTGEVTYPAGIDTAFDPYHHFSTMPDQSQMYGGMLGGSAAPAGPSGMVNTDADNYFWTTFMPDANTNPYQ